jgi:hypothetical protein
MPQLREDWRNDALLRHFVQHVVPIYFDLRKGDARHHVIFTAFLFSVEGNRLLMTAGHCITKMKEWREHGYQIVACSLIDSLGVNARFRHPVPFDYDGAEPTMLGIHHTWDYGVLFPAYNTCQLLEANGITAFTERSWEPLVEQIEIYRLLGIPSELTVATANDWLNVTMLFPRVERLDERPEGFEETNAPMFYGRLPTNPLTSLLGMSGGPILALAHVDGQARYWLHAMQVSSLGDYISGMLMRPIGKYMQAICAGEHGDAASAP